MIKKSLIQSPEAIEKMRVAGKLASDVLVMLDQHVRVGISTEALNQIAHDYIGNKPFLHRSTIMAFQSRSVLQSTMSSVMVSLLTLSC